MLCFTYENLVLLVLFCFYNWVFACVKSQYFLGTMRIKCLTNRKDSGKAQKLEKLGRSPPLSAKWAQKLSNLWVFYRIKHSGEASTCIFTSSFLCFCSYILSFTPGFFPHLFIMIPFFILRHFCASARALSESLPISVFLCCVYRPKWVLSRAASPLFMSLPAFRVQRDGTTQYC